jgi:membrane protein implicated in regulation of membrane protease activity
VGALPDAPAVVLVATTLAAALLLIEAALPTFGVAGISAFGLGFVAVFAADDSDTAWWPLLLVVLAVGLWAVVLTLQRPASKELQAVAGGLFAVGSITYGLLATDILTILIAIAASITLPLLFPRLLVATRRLVELPPQLGMEALVGRTAEVERADGVQGTVRIDGSFWNVHSASPIIRGTRVVVVSFSGMTLAVAPTAVVDR